MVNELCNSASYSACCSCKMAKRVQFPCRSLVGKKLGSALVNQFSRGGAWGRAEPLWGGVWGGRTPPQYKIINKIIKLRIHGIHRHFIQCCVFLRRYLPPQLHRAFLFAVMPNTDTALTSWHQWRGSCQQMMAGKLGGGKVKSWCPGKCRNYAVWFLTCRRSALSPFWPLTMHC